MRKFWIVKVILMVAVAVAGFSYLVMLLWNNLIPALFHGPVITWAQALGLLVLSKLLFHGFGNRGGHRWKHWRHRMNEKWAAMTPEEREKFRAEWRHRCGPWGEWEKDSAAEAK